MLVTLAIWLGGVTIYWVSAVVAALFVAVSIVWLMWTYGLNNLCARAQIEIGRGRWDFSKSWASNLAVLGAVLSTLLSAVSRALTQDEQLSIASLNVSFGLLAVTAPVLFYAFGHDVSRNTDWENADLHVEGQVWSFFIASWLTLWAVVGQLMTLAHLYGILSRNVAGTSFRSGLAPIVLIALVGALLMLCIYAFRSIYWTVKWAGNERHNLTAKQNAMFQARSTYGMTAPAATELRPALSEWALL